MDRNEIQNQLKEQEQVRGKAWESVDKENEKSKEEKVIEERQSALSVGQQAGEMMLGCAGRRAKRFVIPQAELREYELKMLQYCDIKGLQRPVVYWRGEQAILEFEQPAGEVSERQLREQPESYIRRLIELERTLPEYLLTVEGLQIRQGGASYFPESGEWQFCYLPLKEKKGGQDLEFFRSLFQSKARLFLQMEMMKEDQTLGIQDYLAAVRQAGYGEKGENNIP